VHYLELVGAGWRKGKLVKVIMNRDPTSHKTAQGVFQKPIMIKQDGTLPQGQNGSDKGAGTSVKEQAMRGERYILELGFGLSAKAGSKNE